MKVTAETITDEQIRDLADAALSRGYDQDHDTGSHCWVALFGSPNDPRVLERCRARCAEFYNARFGGES